MLVVVCGRPCTGKTTISTELAAFFEALGKTVIIINEESLGIPHKEGYKSLKDESLTRSALKSAIERRISRDVIVIADSMNYVKGYRYELYCVSRAQATTRVTLFVDTAQDVAAEWNVRCGGPSAGAAAGAGSSDAPAVGPEESEPRYTPELFGALWSRFEPPDEANRWDSPLFRLDGDAEPDAKRELFEGLAAAVVDGKRVKPPQSVTSIGLADTNYLHVLDKATQEVVSAVQEALSMGRGVGDVVRVPDCPTAVTLTRRPTPAELARLRRQFIKMTTGHPGADNAGAARMFVDYINTSLAT